MTEDELLAIVLHNASPPEPSEFIINGGFVTDTDWTKGAGWTISGGAANQSGGPGNLSQPAMVQPLIAGHSYTVTFTYTGFATGLTPGLSSPAQGGMPSISGSPYSHTFVATGASAGFLLQNIDEEVGTVDNVSLVPA